MNHPGFGAVYLPETYFRGDKHVQQDHPVPPNEPPPSGGNNWWKVALPIILLLVALSVYFMTQDTESNPESVIAPTTSENIQPQTVDSVSTAEAEAEIRQAPSKPQQEAPAQNPEIGLGS